ncbi:MAG TPA: hypothetical protein VMH38_00585, partial [Thermoplasmata archaeon]|nr:hypothetical protein [Thermoplasmata archaeon]
MTGPPDSFWVFLILVAPAVTAVLSLVPLPGVSRTVSRAGSLVTLLSAIALMVGQASGRWGSYLGL